MEQLAEDFKGQFQCVEENMEKYITFSVLIKKKKCDDGKTITHKLKFIGSFRFMPVSLSDLVDNLSEISKIDCFFYLYCIYKEKKTKSVSKLIGLKNNKLKYKCKEC